MKPSDSKERVRERVQRHRAGVTPHVTPWVKPGNIHNVTPPEDVTPLASVIPPTALARELPQRTKGKTPEESGYPEGQVDVHTGPQGQRLWRLNGHYDMPNRILCMRA